jgi:flagellar biosynthetic protein FlhB
MSEQGEGEGGGEKVFDPTPQRLAEARKKGDIPRSADVTAAATYLALLVVVATAGGEALDRAASVLMVFIAHPDRLIGHVLGPGGPGLSGAILGEALWDLAPVFLVPIVAVLLGLFAQQAVTFSTDKLQPKWSRLSILGNARRKFGRTGLVEFAKATTKLGAIAVALFLYLGSDLDRMVGAATAEPRVIGRMMVESLMVLLVITCLIAVAIAGVDVVWQRFDHARRLRMSYQDLREETKQSEGDPHMKAQRRSRAEAIATNRMLFDVPMADVVIVNPTHYAVALRWSRAKGSAPVCVAKGEDELALRIREVAATARVPIHEDPPTARALHATVAVGREIAPEHYRAVAAAIRFADRMRKAARARGLS